MNAPSDTPTRHPLLFLLDAVVRRDPAPSGFSGALAIGVLEAEGVSWWQGRFGVSPSAHFVTEPDDEGTWLLLGEREADAILRGQQIHSPATMLKLAGDPSLVKRFTDRYVRRRDLVALRQLSANGDPS